MKGRKAVEAFARLGPCCFISVVLLTQGFAGAARGQEADATVAATVAFADGIRAFNEGSDPDALERFTRVLDLQPRNGTARYWRGLTLLRLGRAAEAVTEIERGLREGATQQVNLLWGRHDLGGAQLATGETAAAERTLGEVAAEVEKRLKRLQPKRVERAEREDLEWEEESRLAERRSDELLLARTLLRQGEALDRLDRPQEAAAARERAAVLAPDLREAEVMAPPWEGELPPIGTSARGWDASIGLSTFGDSNPSLLSEKLSVDTPDAGIQLVRGGESDQAIEIDVQAAFRSGRSFGGWSLGAGLEGRQSFYQDIDFFNTGELQAVVYTVRGGAPAGYLTGPLGSVRVAREGERRFSLLLQGGIDHITLDGSGYLTTAEGSASAVYRPSDRWAGQVDLHILNRSYEEEPVAGRRSGTETRLGVSQIFSLGADRILRLEMLGGERSAGLPFETSLLRGTAELSLPFYNRAFNLSLRGSWQQDDYANPESDLFFFEYDLFNPIFKKLVPHPTLRTDITLRAAAALSWVARPSLQLTTRFVWIDRDTNLDDNLDKRLATFDYRRTILSLGASWLF